MKPSKLHLLVAKFGEHLKVQGYASLTIAGYIHHLQFFLRFLESLQIEDITEVSRDTMHSYQVCLSAYENPNHGNSLSLGSQANKITALRSFFKYLLKSGYILYDSTSSMDLPRLRKTLPKDIMSKKEVRKLLTQPNPDTPLGLRDKAILEVLYSTGIRSSELTNLSVYDIDVSEGDLRVVQGKNAKDRVIPIGEIACKYVEEYLNQARPKLVKDMAQRYLFLTNHGNKTHPGEICLIIKGYAKKAKLKKHITTHSLRHTCATHLLRGGASLRHIQEILGHSSLETTQIYTQVEVSDLKKAHRKAHPRERA